MQVRMELVCAVELVPVRTGLGIERRDVRLAHVVPVETLRPMEQCLALPWPGDRKPPDPGVLRADSWHRHVLPRRRLGLPEVTEVTAPHLRLGETSTPITRHKNLER